MDSETSCKTFAELYAAMAKTSEPPDDFLWANAARRWWFYRRVARRLGRAIHYHESEKLFARCWPNDLTTGFINHSVEEIIL